MFLQLLLIHRIWLIEDKITAEVISTSWLCNRGSLWRTLLCHELRPCSAWSSLYRMQYWCNSAWADRTCGFRKVAEALYGSLCNGFKWILISHDLRSSVVWQFRSFLPKVVDITSLWIMCIAILSSVRLDAIHFAFLFGTHLCPAGWSSGSMSEERRNCKGRTQGGQNCISGERRSWAQGSDFV